jgi:hypothetical protein
MNLVRNETIMASWRQDVSAVQQWWQLQAYARSRRDMISISFGLRHGERNINWRCCSRTGCWREYFGHVAFGHVARIGEKSNVYKLVIKDRRAETTGDAKTQVDGKYWDGVLGRGGMNWNDLTQDRDQWRALVNTILNLWINKCWEVLEWMPLKKGSAPWS